MIDISNISNVEWENTKISVLGAGKSGLAATNLALSVGAHVLISEYGDSIDTVYKKPVLPDKSLKSEWSIYEYLLRKFQYLQLWVNQW